MVGPCYQSVSGCLRLLTRRNYMLTLPLSKTSAEISYPIIILFGTCYHGPSDIVCRNPPVKTKPNILPFLAGLRYNCMATNPANGRYLRSDFNEMIRKVTIVQILIDAQVPRIADLFEEYKEALAVAILQNNEVRDYPQFAGLVSSLIYLPVCP